MDFSLKTDPYDKLVKQGPQSLTTAELVSIVIRRNSNDTSLTMAESLVGEDNAFYRLASAKSVGEIKNDGITERKAASLLASIELGKRFASAEAMSRTKFTKPADVAAFIMPQLRYETQEKFLVIMVNAKNKVISTQEVSRGSLSSSVVHPREVFFAAIASHAGAIFVAHNHPSGDTTPSGEDINLTIALKKTGEVVGIPVLDHIIIGDGLYYSFAEHHCI